GLVSRVDASEAVLTYHFDPRGSAVAMTDSAGTVVNSYGYDEFGAVREKSETVVQPFEYVGQCGVMQEASGLLFMRARYYATESGRFVSVAPRPVSITTQDWNWYAYTNGTPVRYVDPHGL